MVFICAEKYFPGTEVPFHTVYDDGLCRDIAECLQQK